ncbi:hypothetical protein [Pseudobacteriovorax antillogorgiicola]|uniref:Uncharacterized protein n=1 Tax=Pseudobacteriovorax antillogorgiicola TaxID=1513793 RepID=A0A1Y6BF08_9BACT|nr:hypothetical protein [Pseudobacteriovorax antillogorgiicola]TCS57510.1 hypothetical protein EDD56_103250 [Pseudobacteriovorax antillogorgiicola]SMF00213.1 hypothetical protein SAMN06296036_10383 [Pseudobacteriovorax antillogorgiicola]
MKLLTFILVNLLITPALWGKSSKIFREEYSSLEDVAIDIPRNPEKYQWIIRDTIDGKKISTNGAPVVRFYGGSMVIVSSVPSGTPITLDSLRIWGSINYWPVLYKDDQGQEQQGWVSGMFVERK